jgi:hypothetical protein
MFIPYKRFTIETTLTLDEATQALSQEVQPSRPFWPNPFSNERRHFVGSVTKKGFRVIRNIYYLNSFLPEIKGTIESSGGITSIKITMIGNPWISICFIAVFAFCAFFLMLYLPTQAISNSWLGLTTSVAGLLGYLTYTSALSVEMAKDSNYLMALFQSG